MVQELDSFVSILVSLQVWNISHVCLACSVSHSSKRHHASSLLQTLLAPYRSDVGHIGHLGELFQPGFSHVSCSRHCWTSVMAPGPPNPGSACRQQTKGVPNKRMNWNRQNETSSLRLFDTGSSLARHALHAGYICCTSCYEQQACEAPNLTLERCSALIPQLISTLPVTFTSIPIEAV